MRRNPSVDEAFFVYVTYIAAIAEAVWNAIVVPKISGPYWENVNPDTQTSAILSLTHPEQS
jgi:hypothetical protein